jgi:DNA invertase Pin-like site-specific DNA recombinase
MRIKYNRVSTLQQTGERFNADAEKYNLTLLDKVSGSVSFDEREQGKKLLDLMKEGKVKEVVVEELSRLGRNTGDVIRTQEM